jgi:hypothetical protein
MLDLLKKKNWWTTKVCGKSVVTKVVCLKREKRMREKLGCNSRLLPENHYSVKFSTKLYYATRVLKKKMKDVSIIMYSSLNQFLNYFSSIFVYFDYYQCGLKSAISNFFFRTSNLNILLDFTLHYNFLTFFT